jgi:hypothetical protein
LVTESTVKDVVAEAAMDGGRAIELVLLRKKKTKHKKKVDENSSKVVTDGTIQPGQTSLSSSSLLRQPVPMLDLTRAGASPKKKTKKKKKKSKKSKHKTKSTAKHSDEEDEDVELEAEVGKGGGDANESTPPSLTTMPLPLDGAGSTVNVDLEVSMEVQEEELTSQILAATAIVSAWRGAAVRMERAGAGAGGARGSGSTGGTGTDSLEIMYDRHEAATTVQALWRGHETRIAQELEHTVRRADEEEERASASARLAACARAGADADADAGANSGANASANAGADASARADDTATIPAAASETCTGTCMKGHPLTMFETSFTDQTSFFCDGPCARKGLPTGTTMHGCDICQYDICDDCLRVVTFIDGSGGGGGDGGTGGAIAASISAMAPGGALTEPALETPQPQPQELLDVAHEPSSSPPSPKAHAKWSVRRISLFLFVVTLQHLAMIVILGLADTSGSVALASLGASSSSGTASGVGDRDVGYYALALAPPFMLIFVTYDASSSGLLHPKLLLGLFLLTLGSLAVRLAVVCTELTNDEGDTSMAFGFRVAHAVELAIALLELGLLGWLVREGFRLKKCAAKAKGTLKTTASGKAIATIYPDY